MQNKTLDASRPIPPIIHIEVILTGGIREWNEEDYIAFLVVQDATTEAIIARIPFVEISH